MIQYILIPVSSDSDFEFFSRFRDGLAQLGYRLVLITNKISLLIRSKAAGIECHLVTVKRARECSVDLSQTADVFLGYLTRREAEDLFQSFYHKAEVLASGRPIDAVFFWNGSQSPQNLGVKQFATMNRIRTLFFEAPNIDKMLFADPRGVNAESFIYGNVDYLSTLGADGFDYEAWRREFIDTKERMPVPPQAKINKGINNLMYPLDVAAFRLLPVPKSGNASLIKKLTDKAGSRFPSLHFDAYDLTRADYVFFPMQVRWDTQLLVNSRHTNMSGIAEAARIASANGRQLLVKPHPAENDFSDISAIMELKQQYGFKFVNDPSIRLVRHADRIVTINSSVALEAFLLDKPVHFLGRSLYEKMNHDLLRRFIGGYLFKIDKYANESLAPEIVQRMLERSKLQAGMMHAGKV